MNQRHLSSRERSGYVLRDESVYLRDYIKAADIVTMSLKLPQLLVKLALLTALSDEKQSITLLVK